MKNKKDFKTYFLIALAVFVVLGIYTGFFASFPTKMFTQSMMSAYSVCSSTEPSNVSAIISGYSGTTYNNQTASIVSNQVHYGTDFMMFTESPCTDNVFLSINLTLDHTQDKVNIYKGTDPVQGVLYGFCHKSGTIMIAATKSDLADAYINKYYSCVEYECEGNETTGLDCWDGSYVIYSVCKDGYFEQTNNKCPPHECEINTDCKVMADNNCDGKQEQLTGTCNNYKCVQPEIKRCSKLTIFFNKYKLMLIIGAILLIGGGYLLFEYFIKNKRR